MNDDLVANESIQPPAQPVNVELLVGLKAHHLMGGMDTGVGTFVLPAKVVKGLVEQSKSKAAELLEELAEEAAAAG